MGFKKDINQVRRNIMRGLTGGIGASSGKSYKGKAGPELKRILICRPNDRLGNLLLITPLIQELIAVTPDCTIDLFVRGNAAPVVFKNYKSIDRIIRLPKKPFKQLPKYIYTWVRLKRKRYDLVINVEKKSSSGRLSTLFANSALKFFGDDFDETLKLPGHRHMAKYPVHNLRFFLKDMGYDVKDAEVPTLDLKLSAEEIAEGRTQLEAIAQDREKKTICIFTNATADKKLSAAWWETFYTGLLQRFPQYNIVEALPVENTSQIDFKAPSYYTNDVRELGAFIAACDLFIGADSGVMHLASAGHTTTIGLFTVTDAEMYAPYGNGSAAVDVRQGGVEDWMGIIIKALGIKVKFL